MLVTFNADNSAVFDYTPSGGQKLNTNYSFTSDGTIADGIHPENLIVDAEDIDHLRFRPEGKRLREDIDALYVCKFKRITP
jgi:hypothetical protein